MKKKSFAMLIMPGLLVASLAYVAPAMAEDTNNDGIPMGAVLADNNSGNTQTADNSSTDNSSADDNASPDQGSPDTATGDDDY